MLFLALLTPLKSPQGDTTQVGCFGVVLIMLVLILMLLLLTPLKSPQGDTTQVGSFGVVLIMLDLMLMLFLSLLTPLKSPQGDTTQVGRICELNCKLGGWWIGIVTPYFGGVRGGLKKKSLLSQPFCIFRALYKKATNCDRRKINYRLQKNATRSPAKGVQPAVAHVVSHLQALPKKGRRN